MGSPTIFSGKYTKLLTQKGLLQKGGAINQYDGPRNYILNSSFEANVLDGWNRVKTTITSNLPTGTPTIGQDLSVAPSISSFYVNSGSAPFDTYALYFGNISTTIVAGEGIISDAFTVDSGDLGKVLTFKLYYKSELGASTDNWSGVLGSQTWAVYIYDQTAGAWLQPAGFLGMNQNSGVGIVSGTFQSSVVAGQQYRIAVIALKNTTSTSALQVDNIYVGSQTAPIGPVVTDWVSYTPSGTWTTNTTYTGRWRRVGDTAEVDIGLTLSGAPNATTLYVNFLPPGLAIDTSKMSVAASYIRMGYADGTKMPSAYNLKALFVNSTSVLLGYQSLLDASESVVTATAPTTWTSGSIIHLRLSFPLAGASSNVQLSSDTDTRVVSAIYSGISTGSYSTTSPVNFSDVVVDTHKAVTTGASWRFTSPVSGIYSISVATNYATVSGNSLVLYKNGSAQYAIFSWSAASSNFSGSLTIPLNAGEYIDLRPDGTKTIYPGIVSIFRLSGPSVVAASETVAMRAVKNAGAHTAPGGSQDVASWTSVVQDTHGIFNATTGVATIPVSGTYLCTFQGQYVTNSTGARTFSLLKNGTSNEGEGAVFLSFADRPITVGAVVLKLNAGDTLRLSSFQNSGGNLNYSTFTATATNFNIVRVGN